MGHIHACVFLPLDKSGIFTIVVQSVDNVGQGTAAVLHGVEIVSSRNLTTQNSFSTIKPSDETTRSYKVTKRKNPTSIPSPPKDIMSQSQTAAIAGGVAGAIVFLVLTLLLFLFMLRRIAKKRRLKSIQVKHILLPYSTTIIRVKVN